MGKSAVDITKLTRDEQMALLDELWESLGREAESLPLDQAQRAELNRRLDELEIEGPIGLQWDDVVRRARAQHS